MHPRTHSRPRRRGTQMALAALLGLVTLLGPIALAGCSGTDEAPTAGPAEDGALNNAGGDVARAPEASAQPGQGEGGAGAQPAPVAERSLIYRGTITVRVESVVQAADRAVALVAGLGGIVAGDSRTIEESGAQATLELRVPADTFSSTLDSLADLGTEESRNVRADDVTETLVDLDARIATQQASVNRVRELLARAQTIAEIVSIESELTRREADLDSLLQRRATMTGLVDLATITVVLFGPSGPVETVTEDETGFMAGLRSGWHGFLASVTVVLTVAGWLLPWLVAIGGPVLLVVWLVRRRRRRRRAPASAE